ncbi:MULTISPECIES: hypothetical protein [Bradyrhizobium]|jgi:hypothetical protein|uniref:Integrase n=2 Tax=Bradyrhizobium TaxID=374 RepID=A0ABY0Q6T8_9BRAD|nr:MULTISPECIES: hypothetical protein [Bradyrhizobium]SDJ62126.1 hypothetical protein SAMN05444163_5945 [Bradyrhizobium ottawaense]SEC35215.1 hypothetical protein SAMN05444171_1212 [Bradyrhizobium lablabi]SHK61432.1 hypothetical protein SAMN05444321_0051 [Bradyrhizobium lablabi]
MAYFIHARDAAGGITLRRESREAAVKKAEVRALIWLKKQFPTPGKTWSHGLTLEART